jgi:hypothetical protein
MVEGAGKFTTRLRYDKEQARALLERNSKAVTLNLPAMFIPEDMRHHIAEEGLPLLVSQFRQIDTNYLQSACAVLYCVVLRKLVKKITRRGGKEDATWSTSIQCKAQHYPHSNDHFGFA